MHNDVFSVPTVKVSLTPLKIVALMMVVLPGYGIWDAYSNQVSLLGVTIDHGLLISYLCYTVMMSFFICLTPSSGLIAVNPLYLLELNGICLRSLLVSLLCFFEIFWVSGRHTVSGSMDRGEVRSSLGTIGPFYNFTVKYLLTLLALLAVYNLILCKNNRIQNYFALLLIVLSALMTGYKSTLIMVMLPSSCLLWPLTSLQQKGLLFFGAFSFIVISNMFFSDISIDDARRYVAARATTIAAYGLAGSWDYAASYPTAAFNQWIFSFFGNNISEKIFDTFNINFAGSVNKLITVAYYPNIERAEEGSVNLTLTLFGELSVLFGRWWFLAAFLYGAGFVKTFNFALWQFFSGRLNMGLLALIFITFVLLPALNSGGIFGIISLPTTVNLIVVYICLRFIVLQKNSPIIANVLMNKANDDAKLTSINSVLPND
ncbi:membrane hypothetical protein [Crenothrix polyspora]|uniref:Uncharacterized protein n=2 Tax=Crenothrix polyspora TaxID=360316 RepID=A0A1R4HA23_9GAMM|nr:membrane hypothetical protein [Crenothrix polyspora]